MAKKKPSFLEKYKLVVIGLLVLLFAYLAFQAVTASSTLGMSSKAYAQGSKNNNSNNRGSSQNNQQKSNNGRGNENKKDNEENHPPKPLKKEQDGLKLKYVPEDSVSIEAGKEEENEDEISDSELNLLNETLSENDIEIATGSANRIVLRRGKSKAVTSHPLSIDLATNTLIVTTPKGEKAVTVLPDVAVQNMINSTIVSRLKGSKNDDDTEDDENEATGSGELDDDIDNATDSSELDEENETETPIELELNENDELVYVIDGVLDEKLLGIIPVEINKKVTLSAETGEVLNVSQSFFEKLLDFFSF